MTDPLAGLTAAQDAAARATGPIAVLAGAGTGKTKTLVASAVDRIEHRGVNPHRLLAVTFTNKAAREMSERLGAALGPMRTPGWVGTFHAHGSRQIRQDPGIADLRPGFAIVHGDDCARIVRRLVKRQIAEGSLPEEPDTDPDRLRKRIRGILAHIGRFKEEMVLPEEALRYFGAAAEPLMADAARIYPLYQAELQAANAADFGDLLMYPTRTMMRDESYRLEWARRFDAILVDEFQDVNLTQYRWIHLLSRDHRELFAVGDDDQSIYSWRGAQLQYFRDFLKAFPDGQMVALERNFRSTGHILDAANGIISLDPKRLRKTLYTEAGPGDPIEIVSCKHGADESRSIAREIGRLAAEGVNYHDIAVLYRYNYLSRGIEDALLRARIPYVIVGDTGFWERAIVKDMLAFLRLVVCPDDRQSDEAFRRVVNVPARGVGERSLAQVETLADARDLSLCAAAGQMPGEGAVAITLRAFTAMIRGAGMHTETVAGKIARLADSTGYRAMLQRLEDEGRERLENLAELEEIAAGFDTPQALFDHAALGAAAPGEALDGRVRLMTLHASKGLEFPRVFLPGWDETLFPLPTERTNFEEERRLAYVAVTRAMRRATITWCAERGSKPSGPSPFIDDIPIHARSQGWLRHIARR